MFRKRSQIQKNGKVKLFTCCYNIKQKESIVFFMFLLTCTKYLKYSIVPPPVASAGTLRAYGQVDNFFRGLFVSKIN